MKSHEILKRVVDSVGTKKVARDLGVSSSLVYKWCAEQASELGEDGSGVRNPLDRLISLFESTGDRSPIEWLCTQTGGYFVESLDPGYTKVDVEYIQQIHMLLAEFSDLMRVVSASIVDDGRVDIEEASSIRTQVRKLQARAETFVRACEQGVFDSDNDGE